MNTYLLILFIIVFAINLYNQATGVQQAPTNPIYWMAAISVLILLNLYKK